MRPLLPISCPALWPWLSVLTVGLLLTGASSGTAQVAATLVPGSLVRITAPALNLQRAVGTVKDTVGGGLTVVFQRERGTLTVGRSRITALDISTRRGRHALEGLGIGVLVGGVGGALFGAAESECRDCILGPSLGSTTTLGAIVFGVLGGLTGLVIGALIRTDTWTEVEPEGAQFSMLPIAGEHGTGVRLGFTHLTP